MAKRKAQTPGNGAGPLTLDEVAAAAVGALPPELASMDTAETPILAATKELLAYAMTRRNPAVQQWAEETQGTIQKEQEERQAKLSALGAQARRLQKEYLAALKKLAEEAAPLEYGMPRTTYGVHNRTAPEQMFNLSTSAVDATYRSSIERPKGEEDVERAWLRGAHLVAAAKWCETLLTLHKPTTLGGRALVSVTSKQVKLGPGGSGGRALVNMDGRRFAHDSYLRLSGPVDGAEVLDVAALSALKWAVDNKLLDRVPAPRFAPGSVALVFGGPPVIATMPRAEACLLGEEQRGVYTDTAGWIILSGDDVQIISSTAISNHGRETLVRQAQQAVAQGRGLQLAPTCEDAYMEQAE